ncbi:MAG: DUF2797 domain-containing protein [Candidatus Heimdallarchaeota archaeon]
MRVFIIHFGWKLKPKTVPYLVYLPEDSTKEEVYALKPGANITIKIAPNESKYCIGFNNYEDARFSCPTAEKIPMNRSQCQSCSLNEFFFCRALCQGDFCQPSSEEAKEYCWKKNAYVYLTYIAGKIKVGSSTSPHRRWIGQGSDAGISIAKGVGLAPRALEHQIGTKYSLPLGIRLTQKVKLLGKSIDKKTIEKEIMLLVDEIQKSMKSEILIPRDKLEPITFLDEFYGNIPTITARPILKKLESTGLEISGEIIGIKGTILVVKNVGTYFALNLSTLIGLNATITDDAQEMKGQKSLFDFV